MNRIPELIKDEEKRQQDSLMMIPSENYASKAVREAVGSVLMNKYSEGYAGKRYYQGNIIIDEIENFAIGKAKELFGVEHVNVQPYSGSPANAEVLFALLNYGDKIPIDDIKILPAGNNNNNAERIFYCKVTK